jgi:hypothetical protein
MNTPIERLHTALETLGLKAVEAGLEDLLEQASKKEPSYAEFLHDLLNCEVEARRTRNMRAKLQLAHLPFLKTFEQFGFSFQPLIDERQIRELRSLRFIHEASNVIFLGPPGVGKTPLSVALAEAAIRSGLGASDGRADRFGIEGFASDLRTLNGLFVLAAIASTMAPRAEDFLRLLRLYHSRRMHQICFF